MAARAGNCPEGVGDDTWQNDLHKADQKLYGQRSQSETVMSMIKRNQGSALRSRTPERRKKEMMLRVLTHNIALLCELENED